jgi:hypothetical protein
MDGVDLWHFHTERGIGVDKAFRYLLPYTLNPGSWKKQQISRYSANGIVFPGLAGIGMADAALLAGYRKLPRSESPWVQFNDLLVRSAD